MTSGFKKRPQVLAAATSRCQRQGISAHAPTATEQHAHTVQGERHLLVTHCVHLTPGMAGGQHCSLEWVKRGLVLAHCKDASLQAEPLYGLNCSKPAANHACTPQSASYYFHSRETKQQCPRSTQTRTAAAWQQLCSKLSTEYLAGAKCSHVLVQAGCQPAWSPIQLSNILINLHVHAATTTRSWQCAGVS